MTEMLLTVRDAAQLTKIPASTWRRWITEQRLCATMVKGQWLIASSEAAQLAEMRLGRGYLPSPRL